MNINFTGSSIWCPLFRLYAHALLRTSYVFSDMIKLGDESPDYDPFGFTDIWKENYHGDQVCIKAIRIRYVERLLITMKVRTPFLIGVKLKRASPGLLLS